MLILSNLELPALSYVAPITAISDCQNIDYILRAQNRPVALWEGDLSLLKCTKDPWVMQREAL